MDISLFLSCALDPEGCQIELRLLPGRLVLQKALSPLLIVSPAVGTAICHPNGISLQVYPEEQDDVFPILAAMLRIDPASVDYFHCSEPITAGFTPDNLHLFLSIADGLRTAEDEGITVTADYQRMEVAFALGRVVGKTATLGTDIPNNFMEIDDSEFVYAVLVGIASEDFRRIIRHFRHLSPFVEAFVTDEEVTFTFGPEEIVLRTENGNCIIGGINGYHRVNIRLSLLNPDSLLVASELSASVWMFKSPDSPDLLSFPVQQLGNVVFYFRNEHRLGTCGIRITRFFCVNKGGSLIADLKKKNRRRRGSLTFD